MSCIKSLPEICRLGIARVGIRTLLLVLFTCVTQHTAVLLGNSSTLNKRGEYPPRCNRTTPADFSLANPAVNAQTIFSFSAVMAFHEALIISSLNCTMLLDMVCCLLSNVCVVTSFYQSLQAMSSFMLFLICASYCTLSKPLFPIIEWIAGSVLKSPFFKDTAVSGRYRRVYFYLL